MPNQTSPRGAKVEELLAKEELTTKEAGEVLGLSPAEVWRNFDEGRLKGRTSSLGIRRGRIKIYRDSLVEFAKNEQGVELVVPKKKK